MGPVSKFLGNYITRDRSAGTLGISQAPYIQQLLADHQLLDATPKSSPMAVGANLPTDTVCDVDVPFLSLLGGLSWVLRNSRPDIQYSITYHSQFTNCYTHIHYVSLKRVLLYLLGTKDWCLVYRKQDSVNRITLYSDTDWAGCKVNRRSHMGNLAFVDGNLVDWFCRKQRVVTLSSMEAEYIGYCSSTRTGMHIYQLLKPFTKQELTPIPIYGDNAAAEIFASKQTINEKTKHIEIAYHYVREKIAAGVFVIVHIQTTYNLADLFTKALTSERTQWLGKVMLGITVISSELNELFRPSARKKV